MNLLSKNVIKTLVYVSATFGIFLLLFKYFVKTPSNFESTSKVLGLCKQSDHYVCLDFEGIVSDSFFEEFEIGSDAKIVRDEEAYSGTGAMRFFSKGTKNYHQSYLTKRDIPGTHWGRLFYKLKTPTPITNEHTVLHATFVALRAGNYEARVVDTVQENSSKTHQYLYNVQIDNDVEGGMASDYNWSFSDEWICVEWHIDDTTQTYEFFREGIRIDQISNAVTFPSNESIPKEYESIKFGLQTYQKNPGMKGWMDDIVVSSKRVGCGS